MALGTRFCSTPSFDRKNIFMITFRKYDIYLLEELVQMGHNVNSQDARGNSILHHIYENYNDFQLLFNRSNQILLEKG